MPVEDPEPFIGAIKFSARLDLEQISLFVDGHVLSLEPVQQRDLLRPQ
jgi:hypothetical protein